MNQKKPALKILLVEDSDTDTFIIQNTLRRYKKDAQCIRVSTLKAGEEILQKKDGVDLLLLDLGLPDTPSPEDTYKRMKKWANKLPIIILTNIKDHNLAKTMVQEGAADFLNKDILVKTPELIKNTIDFAVERHAAKQQILSEKEAAQQESKEKDTVLSCFMGGYSVSGK